jgi:hypothetical protein
MERYILEETLYISITITDIANHIDGLIDIIHLIHIPIWNRGDNGII